MYKSDKSDKETLKTALERFKMAEEASDEFRKNFKEDLKFISDDQWDSLARQERTQSSRPCFTVDRLNPQLRQIVNEERMNRPSVQVNPTSGGASEDVANVLAGMIRHIEQDSGADAAYDLAGWYAAAGGLGFLRVKTLYEDENSFDQKLYIEEVADPMTVFIDPSSVDSDGHDMEWAFIVDTLTKDDFKRRFPECQLSKDVDACGGWKYYSSDEPDWITSDSVRIAEYFYKEYKKKTLYQLQDNTTGEVFVSEELPPDSILLKKGEMIPMDRPTITELNRRISHDVVVKHCLLTSEEILQESEFAGKEIPIIPVYGEDYFVDGKRFTCGAIRRAKDAQKLLNFSTSLQAELVDLNAKAPYIGAAGQFDTFEDEWGNANRKNWGFLQYNVMDVNGSLVPAPNRNVAEAPINGAQATKMQAVEDIKAIFGIFDASLGAGGNETSGVAILARKQQSGISNYHYYDNLVRSVRRLGRILVDIIPAYYDTPRMVRIIKPNGNQELVAINQLNEKGKMLDLSVGKYDVAVQTGPSYSTRRQEAVEGLATLIQSNPQLVNVIGDLAVQEMDWPMAKQAADRIRATIPAEILQATEEGDMNAEEQLPIVSAQLRQASKNLEALNAHAAAIEQELKVTKDEMTLLKMKQDVELKKAELDQMVKLKGFEIDEQKTELDFLIKEQEIIIQKRQLEIEESKIALLGAKQMSDMEDKMFDKTIGHVERVATMKPGEGELDIGDLDAIDSAQPSDMKAPPSGI